MGTRKYNLSLRNASGRFLLDKVFHTKGFRDKLEKFRDDWGIEPSRLDDVEDDYKWHDWFSYLDSDLADGVDKLMKELNIPAYYFEVLYQYLMTDKFNSSIEEDPEGLVLVVDDTNNTAHLIIGPNVKSADYKKAWPEIKRKLPFKIIDTRRDGLAIKMFIYREYKQGKTAVEISKGVIEYINDWETKTNRKFNKEPYRDLQYIRDIISNENDKHQIPKSERKKLKQGRTKI